MRALWLLAGLLLLTGLGVKAGESHHVEVDGIVCGWPWADPVHKPRGEFHRSPGSWDSETTHVKVDETGRVVAVEGETLTLDGRVVARRGDRGAEPVVDAAQTAMGGRSIQFGSTVEGGVVLSVHAYLQRYMVGELAQFLDYDLDGNGQPEGIGLEVVDVEPSSDTYRSRLIMIRGGLDWQAPDHPAFAFGRGPDGEAGLDWVGRLAGRLTLLSAIPSRDNGPTVFRRFQWTGTEFVPLPPRMLLETAPGYFAWGLAEDWTASPGRWVKTLKGPPEEMRATLQAWRDPGLEEGEAVLVPVPGGFRVQGSTRPLP